ncbi:hypothetical protein HFP72_29460 [Nocardiopsis sp. ARC36]
MRLFPFFVLPVLLGQGVIALGVLAAMQTESAEQPPYASGGDNHNGDWPW